MYDLGLTNQLVREKSMSSTQSQEFVCHISTFNFIGANSLLKLLGNLGRGVKENNTSVTLTLR